MAKTIFNMADGILTPCNVACGWLWDDMPWNSPKRPPYWNSTAGFDFDDIIACSQHVILRQSPKFYPNRTTLSRKNDVMSIFKMADLSHLGF